MLLKELSYYQTGGECRLFYAPENPSELRQCLLEVRDAGLPLYVMGAGSNSLLSDEPWPGAVLSFHRLRQIEPTTDGFRLGAGITNTELSELAYEEGYRSAAWMYRLPGQLGGSVRMNARCYGGEFSDIVSEVEAFDPEGNLHRFVHTAGDDGVFRGYKDTHFMDHPLYIVSVLVSLQRGDKDHTLAVMKACEADRQGKGQFDAPSCGCVFKNDYRPQVSVPSGMLLEAVGLKGVSHGGASVSKQHANFVFNQGASSREILELTLKMRDAVWQEFGVWLSYEMEIMGSLPADLKERLAEVRDEPFADAKLNELRRQFQGS